jgi:putative protease
VTIDGDIRIVPGDGVCWFGNNMQLQGSFVNKVNGRQIVLNQSKGISVGSQLYRNHDHSFISEVNKNRNVRKIPIQLYLTDIDEGYRLTALDIDGNQASVNLITQKEQAVKEDQAIQTIRKQLARTGETPYFCKRIYNECTFVPFIPVGKINELRRKSLQALTDVRLHSRPILQRDKAVNRNVSYPDKEISFQHNVLNLYAKQFLSKHGVTSIEPAAESGLDMHGRTIMRSRQCILRQLGQCSMQSIKKIRIKHFIWSLMMDVVFD